MITKNYTIDAKGKAIGRVASEVAVLLIGKNSTSFARNVAPDVHVSVINASSLKIHESKTDIPYRTYSGYPGGLKEETLSAKAKRRGYGELIKIAVKGMLPKNKLQPKMLKRLSVSE